MKKKVQAREISQGMKMMGLGSKRRRRRRRRKREKGGGRKNVCGCDLRLRNDDGDGGGWAKDPGMIFALVEQLLRLWSRPLLVRFHVRKSC